MNFPVRTCIVCKEKYPKSQLLRFVFNDQNKPMIDLTQKYNARGYYLCRKKTCIAKAREYDILSKVWKRSIPATFYLQIAKTISHKQNSQVEKLIGFAAKSGKLAKGMTAVEKGVNKNQIYLILFDDSTQPSTKKRIYAIYKKNKIAFVHLDEQLSVEHITGKANCKCIGILDKHFASEISSHLTINHSE